MSAAGFEHYELTNYTRPGLYSRHNSAYWDRSPYLGIGNGAHSFDGVRRFWNRRDTREHITAIDAGGIIEEGDEVLTPEQVAQEIVYLGLRTAMGIGWDVVREHCKEGMAEKMIEAGFLVPREGGVRMAEDRWLMLDDVVLRLMGG